MPAHSYSLSEAIFDRVPLTSSACLVDSVPSKFTCRRARLRLQDTVPVRAMEARSYEHYSRSPNNFSLII